MSASYKTHALVLVLAFGWHSAACTNSDAESTCCVAEQVSPEELSLVVPTLEVCEHDAGSLDRVRLVTWNIKAGRERGLERVAEELAALNADIILLQEVDVGVRRTASVDQPRFLADQLGHAYAFAPTIETEGGLYGIATLSRLPFIAVSRIPLSNVAAGEPRTALKAMLCLGQFELDVTNHHADWRQAAAALSVREVVAALPAAGAGVVFTGDFNQEPRSPGPRACAHAGLIDVLAAFDSRPTYASRRIDFVFVGQATFLTVESARLVPTEASDHQALVVDLRIQSAETSQLRRSQQLSPIQSY